MGACCTNDANSRQIDSILRREEQSDQKYNKLLFLGPGGSGKSTIFKQLQFLHADGFTNQDAVLVKKVIFTQIISQMQSILKYYKLNESDHSSNDNTLTIAISTVIKQIDEQLLSIEVADAIKYIWNHSEQIQNVFNDDQVLKHHLLDETTEYFWNEIDRIKNPNYVPTEKDIIYVRFRTTGVVQKKFEINQRNFQIYDVGGQKSERKKWVTCFNEVDAVVFVISLSCYNESMFEDQHTNAMIDALELFQETINNKYFTNTHIILFLNKRDLFEKKILKHKITECEAFQDFDGEDANDYRQTTQYMKRKFQSLDNSRWRKNIYTHLTFAMNKENINSIFCDVMHIVLNQSLGELGITD